ncbi:MAG TPA: hypothetical protein VMV08_01375, partial [Gaiellaceae bacterium]|nr:hypothetical protein [Gaiellaceae bacterium]
LRSEFYDAAHVREPAPKVGETVDSVAIWWHADISERGLCNHAGNACPHPGAGTAASSRSRS